MTDFSMFDWISKAGSLVRDVFQKHDTLYVGGEVSYFDILRTVKRYLKVSNTIWGATWESDGTLGFSVNKDHSEAVQKILIAMGCTILYGQTIEIEPDEITPIKPVTLVDSIGNFFYW